MKQILTMNVLIGFILLMLRLSVVCAEKGMLDASGVTAEGEKGVYRKLAEFAALPNKEKVYVTDVLILNLIAESGLNSSEVSLKENVLKKEYSFGDGLTITFEDILKEMKTSVIPYYCNNRRLGPCKDSLQDLLKGAASVEEITKRLAEYIGHIALEADGIVKVARACNPKSSHILSKPISNNYRDLVTGIMLQNKKIMSVSKYAAGVLNAFIAKLNDPVLVKDNKAPS